MVKVLILGHGEMGRAIETLLDGRNTIRIWERDLETWEESMPLEDAAAEQDFVVFALPTNPHDELAGRLSRVAGPDTVILSIAKGLDEDGRTPAQVFAAHFDDRIPHGLIYGPMIAEDLAAGRPGFGMLGMPEDVDPKPVLDLFAGTGLHLKHTTDIPGISWSVILKNVYVPLLGAADALELGDNMRGFLVTRALEELDRIVQLMGGRAGTAYTVAGLGDLVTTATSSGSHHRQIGHDLVAGRFDRVQGEGVNIRGEGIHTLRMVAEHGLFDADDFPLFRTMQEVMSDPEDIGGRLRRFLDAWYDTR